MKINYKLSEIVDPEERLEDAALCKAMHDEYGEDLTILPPRSETPAEGYTFGRGRKYSELYHQPVSSWLPYWTDEAFLNNANRSFRVLSWERCQEEVDRLRSLGLGTFMKSTRSKEAIFRIPTDREMTEVVSDMAYSFFDGGPQLMVQALCDVKYEHRFLVIDRQVVTHSPVAKHVTPLDTGKWSGMCFETPESTEAVSKPELVGKMIFFAIDLARELESPHCVLDVAIIDGKPGVIELNPMRPGEFGLFACDVRKLAKATRRLLE